MIKKISISVLFWVMLVISFLLLPVMLLILTTKASYEMAKIITKEF